MKSWIYLTFAILAEVVGTSCLKASQGFTKPIPSRVVVTGYGLAFYLLSLTLDTIPVGIGYAVWSGVGLVLITSSDGSCMVRRLIYQRFLGWGALLLALSYSTYFQRPLFIKNLFRLSVAALFTIRDRF